MRKKSHISFWYFVIALLIVTVLLWFFIDINKPKDTKEILMDAEIAAKPIKNTLNTNAIENIEKRKNISDDLLKDIKTYQSTSKSTTKK